MLIDAGKQEKSEYKTWKWKKKFVKESQNYDEPTNQNSIKI